MRWISVSATGVLISPRSLDRESVSIKIRCLTAPAKAVSSLRDGRLRRQIENRPFSQRAMVVEVRSATRKGHGFAFCPGMSANQEKDTLEADQCF